MTTTTVDTLPRTATAEQPGLALAREMRRRWHDGEHALRTEDFLARRPELWACPESAVDLIYEEFCLRQSAADADDGDVERDILRRFPQWAEPLRVMLDCHRRLLESAGREQPTFPVAGERVGEFELLTELARGARGRVFLANQTALGDRPVVLKLTPVDGCAEHVSLARLQHTNIVPLYSVVDDRVRNLRALCMPYFGRATLANVLEVLAEIPPADRTGRDVLAAIDSARPDGHGDARGAGAAREMLQHVSYVQAMCWVTACLADALHFAHERGLVYLDLKPSNVLLATDGQPMLLDLHLARQPLPAGSMPTETFGGTPGYMPPEQRDAMRSLREGHAFEVDVDRRADVYALGALLYEALGGGGNAPPADASRTPLNQLNSRVTLGLSDVVERCLAPRAQDRYPTAAELADDLRRHLTDQPLAGVGNRSAAERWSKWRRRRPGALRAVGTFATIAAVLVIMLGVVSSTARDRRAQARIAQGDGERQMNAGNFAEAVQSFDRGLGLAAYLPFGGELRQQLTAGLASARRLEMARQLHTLADEVRVLSVSADSIPSERMHVLGYACEGIWQKRSAVADALAQGNEGRVADDLQDVAIFAAGVQPNGKAAALRILDEAESMFGHRSAIEFERRRITGSVGGLADRLPAPRTAWEHTTLGRAFLTAGDLPHAAEELAVALSLEPAGRWTNFYSGICAYRMRRYEDAVAAFSVCLGAAPDSAACFYNRALAYAALGQPEKAMHDADRALQCDPSHAPSRELRKTLDERSLQ